MGTSVETHQASHEPVASQASRPISWIQWEAVARACAQITPALSETIKNFWGIPARVTFFSASPKAHYYWQMDDFHVSQLALPDMTTGPNGQVEPASALMRLSDNACASLLTQVLGPPVASFDFKRLSPLEATILNEFSREMLSVLAKSLIKKPRPGRKARPDLVHLIWIVQLEEPEDPLATQKTLRFKRPMEIGKILLTLPIGAIKADPLRPDEPAPAPVAESFFFHVETPARLAVGSTRIPLSDLDQLEPGDLVVFENSQADRLYLIEPDSEVHLPFTPDIPHKERLLVPLNQDMAMMETQQHMISAARQKLWDNLMIEVNAEFDPIKLPLKQLKQMSEGLIVEMGDLIHNEICLSVEGKPLAYGELVIVGDKFGVRIKQVKNEEAALSEEPASTTPLPEAAMMEALTPQPEMPAAAAGEEADPALEQFLNDDFDDTFDDEEDW